MIIQSSNNPIVVDMRENASDFPSIRMAIVRGTKVIKYWNKSDMIIDGTVIKAPLSQEETAAFPLGEVKVLLKWLSPESETEFAFPITEEVVPWEDSAVMGG